MFRTLGCTWRHYRRTVPFVPQMEMHECGPACLAMILRFYGRYVSLGEVRQRCGTSRDGVSAAVLKRAGRSFGLIVRAHRTDAAGLRLLPLPAILYWEGHHFVVLERWTPKCAWILDPAQGRRRVSAEQLASFFSGVVLTCAPGPDFACQPGPRFRWREYAGWLWRERELLGAILLSSALLQGLGLALPYLTYFAVDRVILAYQPELLSWFVAAFAAVAVFQGLMVYIRGRLVSQLQVRLSLSISTELLGHLFRLPFSFFEQRTAGDLAARISNIALVREILAGRTVSVILDSILTLTYGIAMFLISPFPAAVTFVVALLEVVVMGVLARQIRSFTRQELAAQAEANSYLMEALRAMVLIKASGIHQRVQESWVNLFIRQLQRTALRERASSVMEAILTALRISMPLVILSLGASDIMSGRNTLGKVLAFNGLASAFLVPLGSLVASGQQFQLLWSVAERLWDILDAEPESSGPVSGADVQLSERPVIRFEAVSFAYSPHAPAVLRDVDLHIAPGQKVAVVGPTGSGKTTLGKLALGLYLPTQGRIFLDGVDLREVDRQRLRQLVGVVLQDTYLFNDTIAQNVCFYRNLSRADIEWACRMALLHDEIREMPMGYETVIGENGQTLSGGQRQRLAIARALAARPSILLMDEATSNLDPVTQGALEANLASLGLTRLVIAHRLSTVVDADLILVLKGGCIVQRGTHQQLMREGGLYAHLWANQEPHLDERCFVRSS